MSSNVRSPVRDCMDWSFVVYGLNVYKIICWLGLLEVSETIWL